ncbi:MAG: putative bifunctional diguanylate cyclase/phosphodiesterase [Solirubrobacteraceae bacterium]
MWLWLAAMLALGGTLGAVLAGRAVARSDADHARLAFHLASAEIAAGLKQAIQHEEDLVVAAGAFVRSNPRATAAEFDGWTESVFAMRRYPELRNIGLAVLVPAHHLRAFEARLGAERRTPQILPAGRRPYYCLAVAGVARSRATYVPPGLDFCALSPRLIRARDLGRAAYAPFVEGGVTALAVETPVYRGRVVPTTAAGRRRVFVGWLGELLTPSVVLASALKGHQRLPISLRYDSPSSHVAFTRGKPRAGAQSTTIDLLAGREALGDPHEGWTLQTFGEPAQGSVFGNRDSLAALIGGSLLSVMVGLLMLLLSTGRMRALRELSRRNRELSHQALHDTLTGLPNRALVLDRAEQLLARAAREPGMLAGVLFIDIDDFKAVNDNLGHAAGDLLLSTVAERLRGAVREQDTVGRLGGDEFVVLSELGGREATLELLADRLTEILREPVPLGNGAKTISVTASIGVAVGRYASPDALLRDADLALYTAKAAGKDRHVLYDARMHEAQGRPGLEADLSAAVHAEQLFLLYQPICSLPSREVVGVEALVRWRHPQRGIVAPDEFIPLAEESGLIVPIGRWVLSEACRQAAAWAAQGLPIGVSVNVSARQVGQHGFTADVARALQESQIEPSCLTLEITETAIMRNARAAREQLEQVKALGIRIAIDDFGTGYASLSSLQRLPVDILKIDRTFVAALSAGWSRELHKANELLHAILGVGQALSLSVVAEGIEDQGQRRSLEAMGCEMGQGFLLGRPSSAERIELMLRDSAGRQATASPAA